MKRRHLAIIVSGIVPLVLLSAGCSLLPKEAALPPLDIPTPVTTQPAVTTLKLGTITVTASLTVTFGAQQQQQLYFRQGGRLAAVNVAPGDHVAAGQVLAAVESGTLGFDLQRAQLQVRRQQLVVAGNRSRADFVNAPSPEQVAADEIALQEAEIALAQAQQALAGTQIIAPFAGTVTGVLAAAGDEADAYKPIIVLDGDGPAVARTQVDQLTLGQLQAGQQVSISPNDGNPAAIAGTVAIVPPASIATDKATVVLSINQASDRIKPGQSGKATVVVQRKENVLVVPKSAIKTYSGRQFVTVVQGETRQEVSVTTGLDSGTSVEIISGLKPGDTVLSR
ncbi:MAG TPA: efflux RND transporter periplasmic adaptor subunit [Symbiobacteriaceae bacterium]|nr:efflux RND transporter periplasmic adaptor subunit [Symbiobacteriaceae bacterium]